MYTEYDNDNDPIIRSPVNNDLWAGISRSFHLGKFNFKNRKARSTDLEVKMHVRNLEPDTSKPARFELQMTYDLTYAGCGVGQGPLDSLFRYGESWEDYKYSDDFNFALFDELLTLAKKYNRNSFYAGTRKQDACLEKFYPELHSDFDYTEACRVLEEHGLLVDRGFKYGSAWLFREIPLKDMTRIMDLILKGF